MRTNAAVRLWRTLESRELLEDYPIYRGVKNAFGEAEETKMLGVVRGYFSTHAHRANLYVGALIGLSGTVCEPDAPMLLAAHGSADDAAQGDWIAVRDRVYGINSIESIQDVYDVISLSPAGRTEHVEKGI